MGCIHHQREEERHHKTDFPDATLHALYNEDAISPETIAQLDAATDTLKQVLGPNADYWQIGENSRIR